MRLAAVAAALAVAAAAHADAPAPKRDRAKALAALLARTDALAREVAKLRGLPLKHAIPNEVVDRAILRDRFDKQAADQKTADATAAQGRALARWGLVPDAGAYSQLVVDLLVDQIAGYYDTKTKQLTISAAAGDDAEWAELVLAHELDHGLQDESFDLEKLEDLPDEDSDAATARHALVEGDGVALMIELAFARRGHPAPWADPAIAARLVQAMAAPSGDALDKAPLAVREEMLFPYREGFAFVAALRRRHPWSAVDAAFVRPPRSTEQVMHVDKYLTDERPIAIPAAVPPSLAGYTLAHAAVWGELGFQSFLRAHHVNELVASEAAAGWGGDRAELLARDGHEVGLVRLEWDSEADAIEANEAAVRALDDTVTGATVAHTPVLVRWLALDGTTAFVERRGTSLMLAIGVPTYAADALAKDAWTALAPAAQAKR